MCVLERRLLLYNFAASMAQSSFGNASKLISVFVTSPDTHSERRFDVSLTVAQLKVSRLEILKSWSPGILKFGN